MAELIVSILVLLVASRALGEIFERMRQSAMIGEIMAGVLLGPALLRFIWTPEDLGELAVVSNLGVFMLVFLAGLEMSTEDIARAIKGGGLRVGVLGFAIPFTMGYALGVAVGLDANTALVLGLCLAVTALPVSVRILLDLGLTEHRVGKMIVSAAILNDVLALTILGIIMGLRDAGQADLSLALYIALFTVLKTAVLIALVVSFARALRIKKGVTPGTPRALRQLLATFRGRESLFALSILFVLAFASVSELLGLHFVVGAFFGGLLLSTRLLGVYNYKQVERTTSALAFGFLAPIFFGYIGLQFRADAILLNPGLTAVVLAVAVAGKMAGGYLGGLLVRYPTAEAFALGVGLNGRGMVEIVIANLAFDVGLIGPDLFSILVFMTLVTTMMTPPLLRASIQRAPGGAGGQPAAQGSPALAPPFPPAEPTAPRSADGIEAPVVIVGGGQVAAEIARAVGPCTVLERDAEQARMLASVLSEVHVVLGQATNEDDLKKAGVGRGAFVLAVTDDGEANEYVVRFAKRVGARRVIARADRPGQVDRLRALGADAVLNTAQETANAILLELYPADSSMCELFLHRGSPGVGNPLSNFELPRGTVVRSVSRRGKVLVPTPELVLDPRDTIILSGSPTGLSRAREILAGPRAGVRPVNVLALTPAEPEAAAVLAREVAPLVSLSGGGLVVAVPWDGLDGEFGGQVETMMRAHGVTPTVVKGFSLAPGDLQEALASARGPGVTFDRSAAGTSDQTEEVSSWLLALPHRAVGKGQGRLPPRRLATLPSLLGVPLFIARRGKVPRTILALIDGADGADRAGTLGCELALLTGARLTLLVARFEDDAEPREQAAFITGYARSIGLVDLEEIVMDDPNPVTVERRLRGRADLLIAASVPRALAGRDVASLAASGDLSVLLV